MPFLGCPRIFVLYYRPQTKESNMANEKSWAASAASRRAKAVKGFWQKVTVMYGDRYSYEKFEYLGASTKTTVTCRLHGDFVTKPTYLINGSGCPACGKEKVEATGRKRRLGMESFRQKALTVHGNTYEYPDQEYVSNKDKIRIVCPVHGEFLQKPNGHLGGKGCPACGKEAAKQSNAVVSAAVGAVLLDRLQGINPDWQYDLPSYRGMSKPLRAVCRLHGQFEAWPNNILSNRACPGCGKAKHSEALQKRRLTLEEVARRGGEVYGELFEYLKVEHTGHGAMIYGRCTKHDAEWRQAADGHAKYNPCGLCTKHLSRGEDQVFRFLSNLTRAEQRNRSILRPKELDIYLPDANMAVEYCGEYHHSAGAKDEEPIARKKHIAKYRACKEQGIRLITLWESEWKERNYAVRRLLRNAVGRSKGKLMARKCELRRVSTQEARPFYERYHPQGGAGHGEHYALFWKGKMVACMRFVLGANDRGAGAGNRTWTLGRYATRITVAGAASRLFKAFLQDFEPPVVKSFSDNRFFDGGMYEQLGFCLEAEVGEDYVVWSPKLGILPKPHYQRRVLHKRLAEHGLDERFDHETDPRTEAEMTYLMGARRLYDCGKKRWVWTPPG
jgi:hypothetical protein